MEKELAFKTPSIVTYVYEGYMLGIMQANGDKYKEWMLSNYIQLNCHDNFVKEGELFLAFYDDIAIKSPFLKTEKISWAKTRKMGIDIIDYFKKCIDLECYIYLKVDQFYIPRRPSYKKKFYLHDEMIVGYDDTSFILMGYDDKGEISKQKVLYAQLMDALNSNNTKMDEVAWEDDIYILKYVNSDYNLNPTLIKNTIRNYLNGEEPAEYNKRFSNSLKNTVYGVNVYDRVIDYLKLLQESGNLFEDSIIDNRTFRLIKEHKEVMLERIEMLNRRYGNLDDLLAKYKNTVKLAQLGHFLALKYKIKSEKKELVKLMDIIRQIKEDDIKLLSELCISI